MQSQGHLPSGSGEEDFEIVFTKMGMAVILVM